MTSLNESKVENLCIELLQEQGYSYLSQEKQEAEREQDFSQVVLQSRLKFAIKRLNPTIPPEIHQDKIRFFYFTTFSFSKSTAFQNPLVVLFS